MFHNGKIGNLDAISDVVELFFIMTDVGNLQII